MTAPDPHFVSVPASDGLYFSPPILWPLSRCRGGSATHAFAKVNEVLVRIVNVDDTSIGPVPPGGRCEHLDFQRRLERGQRQLVRAAGHLPAEGVNDWCDNRASTFMSGPTTRRADAKPLAWTTRYSTYDSPRPRRSH